jgi:hypothetical protein
MAALKNASKYTEQLDKLADDLQATNPEVAYHLDAIADVIDGKREATTLKFDADEARFMANRFNYNVQKREADEPFMDDFNKSNFEQVADAKKNPAPVKVAYQKVQ